MVTTARVESSGVFLDDGFSTKVALAGDPNISFWERTVKPFGFDNGDAIDIVTMFNSVYRTFAPRSLVTLTEITGTAAYDPIILDEIAALVGPTGNGWVTAHHPNGDTWDFVGYLRLFEPPEHTEGEFPLASFTITPTNRLNDGTVMAPVFTDNST